VHCLDAGNLDGVAALIGASGCAAAVPGCTKRPPIPSDATSSLPQLHLIRLPPRPALHRACPEIA
jgi:hypothetical protein